MQILFPNPFGWTLPSAEKVTALQQQYGFSDTYAEFLRIQNGFRVDNLWDNPQRNRYLPENGWIRNTVSTCVYYLALSQPNRILIWKTT